MAEFLSTGPGIGIVVGVCALALILFLYGVFRRFSRCSWLSWQILILFAATFLLRFLPASDSAAVNAALAPIVLFAAVALVLAIGGWTRHGLLAYAKRPPAFFRFTNRFLGGVTTVLNFVTFFVVIGAPVLVALPLFGVNFAALDPLYASAIWTNYVAPHALDLVVIAVCVLMVRCGYRVGLEKLDLYGTIRAAVSTFDTFSHIGPLEHFEQAIRNAAYFMEAGGVFVFDVNTPYKHQKILAENTFDLEAEDARCCWRNCFDEDTGRVEITIDIDYLETGEHFQERFCEYSYPLDTVQSLLEKYGFAVARVADGEDFGPVRPDSPRWIITAVKQYTQEGKN